MANNLSFVCGAALTAAALVGPSQGLAATVTTVIDQFDSEQYVSDIPSAGLEQGSEVAAPTAIGGYRDLYVNTFSSDLNATSARVDNGVLSFSNDALARGEGYVTWDGLDGDPLNVDEDGLGGINLIGGMDPFFAFDVLAADHTLEFTFNVWDINGGFSSYFEQLPPIEQLETNLYFSQFTGDADFSQVGALQIFVNAPTTALDAAISSVTVQATPGVIPLPASAFLLLGGLGGLATLRARRRKV